MGFKDGCEIIAVLNEFSKRRTLDEGASVPQCYYDLGKPDADSLPADALRFPFVVVDLSIWVYNLCYRAATGADVLASLQHMIDEDALLLGTQMHIFCLDRRQFVWNAKAVEHVRRAAASDGAVADNYAEFVTLAEAAGGGRVPTASYQYALDAPMPADLRATKATPALYAKLERFLATLVAEHLRAPPAAVNSARPHVIVLSSDEQRSVVFAPGAAEATRDRAPGIEVGEGELQCIYYADQILCEARHIAVGAGVGNAVGVLLRTGDTDSVALALMRARHLHEGDRLWIDLTHAGRMRMLDVVQMHHNLMASVRRLERAHDFVSGAPPPRIAHPIEWLVLLMNLSGNDYCERTSHVTLRLMLDQFETLFKFATSVRPPPLMICALGGDMTLDEPLVVAFLLECVSKVRSVAAYLDSRDGRQAIGAEKAVQARFDHLAQRFTARGKGSVVVLSYEEMRAQVRRAAATLHMQQSAHRPEFRHTDAFALGPDGRSLYGCAYTDERRPVRAALVTATDELEFPFLRYRSVAPRPRPPQPKQPQQPRQRAPPPKRKAFDPTVVEEIEEVDDGDGAAASLPPPSKRTPTEIDGEDFGSFYEEMSRSLANSSGYLRRDSDQRQYGSHIKTGASPLSQRA